MNHEERVEFIALLNALLNETITPEEHAHLSEMLRGNPDAIAEYLMYVDLHTGFKELEERNEDEESPLIISAVALSSSVDSGEDTLPIAPPTQERAIESSLASGSVQRPEGAPKRSSSSLAKRWGLAISAAIVAVAVLIPAIPLFRETEKLVAIDSQESVPVAQSAEQQSGTPEEVATLEPFAVLSQAANAELFYEQIPQIGSPIRVQHEYTLVKGILELSFNNGATAVISSPAVFNVVNPLRIEMKMGRCSVHATESATGFEVVTPQGRVVDLGTRFSVVAKEAGESDVQVVEGAVVYHPKAGEPAGQMLLEGEAVRIQDVSQKSESIPFNRKEYQNEFPDRVISYQAEKGPDGVTVQDLISVTLQRGGTIQTIPAKEMIGVDVIHFSASHKTSSACSGDPTPPQVDRLLSDNVSLNAGITNFDRPPGEAYVPAQRFSDFRERFGLAVRFREPVINRPGPDVVLFDLQSAAYPPNGDPFYVSPIEDLPGLKTHHVERYDITMHSENALQVAPIFSLVYDEAPRSFESLKNATLKRATPLRVPFHAIAVGIDLSNLGYQDGASVPGIFLEDADEDEFIAPDVVFIGGLP